MQLSTWVWNSISGGKETERTTRSPQHRRRSHGGVAGWGVELAALLVVLSIFAFAAVRKLKGSEEALARKRTPTTFRRLLGTVTRPPGPLFHSTRESTRVTSQLMISLIDQAEILARRHK